MPKLSIPLSGRLWARLATLGAPALRWHLQRRVRLGKEVAARLPERWGFDPTPRPPGTLLWLHAASVGETQSILPVLAALPGRVTVLLTTGTVTSAELLALRLPAMGLSERVLHRFAPLDVPGWVAGFLDHWRPHAAGFVESELWPNLLIACRIRGIPAMLINARLSARSYAAWQRAPRLARFILAGFRCIHARGAEDADRLRTLGAGDVEAAGDLKLAADPLPVDCAELARLRALLADRPVWLAASTHPGEETLVAAAHAVIAARHPGLLTIIVPRHPERGPAIAAAIGATRRSAGEPPPEGGLWVADTLGELGLWYRLAPLALVGRSLLPPGGGQNPLEPARLGCAVMVGPHTGNFAEHVARLRAAGGLLELTDASGLADAVSALLADPARRQAMAEAAVAEAHRHADLPARTAAALLALLPED